MTITPSVQMSSSAPHGPRHCGALQNAMSRKSSSSAMVRRDSISGQYSGDCGSTLTSNVIVAMSAGPSPASAIPRTRPALLRDVIMAFLPSSP